ncbi:MAG: DUF4870 domain-containing protein [Synechococcales bacterium]|nr:DUF4870 domain-containing protein [Synechococcales bacterium]
MRYPDSAIASPQQDTFTRPINQPMSLQNPTPENAKLLSVLCHASGLLATIYLGLLGIIIPIVIMASTEDEIVKSNAKEAINFHISTLLYSIIFAILACFLIGIPLLILLSIACLILPIIAMVKCAEDHRAVYSYPFVLRLLT